MLELTNYKFSTISLKAFKLFPYAVCLKVNPNCNDISIARYKKKKTIYRFILFIYFSILLVKQTFNVNFFLTFIRLFHIRIEYTSNCIEKKVIKILNKTFSIVIVLFLYFIIINVLF